MNTVCLVGVILYIILFVMLIITFIVGKCCGGYGGYPDEWENKKCEAIFDIILTAELILTVILIILAFIFAITR